MGTLSALLALCVGNPPVMSGFPSQRPGTRSFGVLFGERLNKRLSKSRDAGDLRRHGAHYNVIVMMIISGLQDRWPSMTWPVWIMNWSSCNTICANECMDEWMDEWMNEWMNRRTDGCVDGCVFAFRRSINIKSEIRIIRHCQGSSCYVLTSLVQAAYYPYIIQKRNVDTYTTVTS